MTFLFVLAILLVGMVALMVRLWLIQRRKETLERNFGFLLKKQFDEEYQ